MPTKSERDALQACLARCAKREPLQYILGEVEFLDVKLLSDKRVLIPLPKTECLVEWVITQLLKQSPDRLPESRNILGLGTRSVAIATALVKRFPMSCILAVDQSSSALEIARLNGEYNQVNNVQLRNFRLVFIHRSKEPRV